MRLYLLNQREGGRIREREAEKEAQRERERKANLSV